MEVPKRTTGNLIKKVLLILFFIIILTGLCFAVYKNSIRGNLGDSYPPDAGPFTPGVNRNCPPPYQSFCDK